MERRVVKGVVRVGLREDMVMSTEWNEEEVWDGKKVRYCASLIGEPERSMLCYCSQSAKC